MAKPGMMNSAGRNRHGGRPRIEHAPRLCDVQTLTNTPSAMPDLKAAALPVTQFQQNCAFLWDENTKDALIVDPGGDVPRILAGIDQLGVRVTKILLTHGHIDHAGGAAALRDELAARAAPDAAPPIEGPDERDAFLLDGLEAQAANYGFAGVRNVRPDRWLAEGDAITLGEHRFEVLHCPGHTPGHIVFINHAAHLPYSATCCSRARSGAPTFPMATMPRCSPRSR
jgi:glyoxylase-like metal-dependent hydrolase (beta-lactamase superfamily II)